ncbi:molybdate ABC transporter substrate-binding protein [Conexibacter sp. SYSU D00693]|uniref:molybdate ABC transporter substrate-binding protein n=1 Tax=Conexibacter sp. SYSU D00693 TaxID=2812560 RepID=UPI00196A41A2|nr:molybdate ABC transporter substrate-binding protein [Conexibacter sp. SYSU D00693]
MPVRRTALLTLLLALGLAAPAHALTVYAAASLREALPAFDDGPRYSFAGSNTLQRQVERGAPADVLLAASPREPLALYRAGRCTRPLTFATNRLVLLVPQGDPAKVRSVFGLRSGRRRLAVGSRGVPIGDYTRQVLQRLRLSSVLRTNTVSQEAAVSGVVAKVALRSADAGFVYATDARAAAGRTDAIALPRRAQPTVRYQGCIVRRRGGDGEGAKAYVRALLGARGRAVLQRFGFGLPPR